MEHRLLSLDTYFSDMADILVGGHYIKTYFDKTGKTYNVSAVSNNTHTVKPAIKMWSEWRSMKHLLPHCHSSMQTSVL